MEKIRNTDHSPHGTVPDVPEEKKLNSQELTRRVVAGSGGLSRVRLVVRIVVVGGSLAAVAVTAALAVRLLQSRTEAARGRRLTVGGLQLLQLAEGLHAAAAI